MGTRLIIPESPLPSNSDRNPYPHPALVIKLEKRKYQTTPLMPLKSNAPRRIPADFA